MAERVLRPQQLDEALESQTVHGGSLDTCILELGFCDEATLERLIAKAGEAPNTVDPAHQRPAVDALSLLRSPDAARWRIVPFAVSGRTVDVVCAFPPDLRVLDEVAFKLGKTLRVSVTTELRLAKLLEEHYGVAKPPRLAALGKPRVEEEEADEPPPVVSDVTAFDPSLRELPRVPTKPPKSAAGHPAPKVPEYTPIAYTPDRFDASLADFADGKDSTGVRQINQKLRGATDRDELPSLLFQLLGPHVRRAALFSVSKGMCRGWDASGPGIDPHRIRTMTFPLAEKSIFEEAAQGDVFVGRMPLSHVNDELARRFGEPRLAQVIVVPIKIRHKVAVILVADCESERALEKAFTHVIDNADKMARTLIRIILEKKKAP